MMKYQINFTVHGILTTFKEEVIAPVHDLIAFRKVLNGRIKDAGCMVDGKSPTVNEMFLIIQLDEEPTEPKAPS